MRHATRIAMVMLVVVPGCTGSSGLESKPAHSGISEIRGTGVDSALGAELRRTVDQAREEAGFPGVSAAVVLPDGSLWAGASGYADIQTSRPVSPHTIFALASMSKTFVSVLGTQLVAEGVLSLEDRVASWMPHFPNAEHITILQLLTGTSGITDDKEHPFTAVDEDPSRMWTLDEFLARVPLRCARRAPVARAPRTFRTCCSARRSSGPPAPRWRRSTGSGSSAPSDSSYQDDGSGVLQRKQGPPGPLTTSWATSAGGAAASMASSAQDVVLWTEALFSGRLLDPSALSTITDFTKLRGLAGSYACSSIGIGFGVGWFDGREVRLANGGIPGFGSALVYFPRERLTVVAVGNMTPADGHDPTRIQAVRDAIARTALALLAPSAPPTSPATWTSTPCGLTGAGSIG